MKKLIFVTGGARSGKSTFAEKLAGEKGKKIGYFATSIPFDEEMKERVKKHRERRPKVWKTIEAYKGLGKIIQEEGNELDGILLDCLTIMVSNIMVLDRPIDWDSVGRQDIEDIEGEIKLEIENLLKSIKNFNGFSIIVSNELGMGIVPATPMGRIFRDIAGKINQHVAFTSDEVYFVISGIPLKIK